jgi:hypothetical protein
MWRLLMCITALVVLFAMLQIWPGRANADDAQNVSSYRQFVDALNRGDAARALALFADDAQLSGTPPFCFPNVCNVRAAIQRELDAVVTDHLQLQLLGSLNVVNGDVSALVALRADPIRVLGLSRINVTDTVTFRADRISKFVVQAETSDPETASFLDVVIYQLETDARNRGDAAAVASLFADNAQQIGGGLCNLPNPCLTKAAILRQAENQAALHTHLTTIALTVSGNTIRALEERTNDSTRLAGVSRIVSLATETYEAGKIVRKENTPDTSDLQTAAFGAFQAGQVGGAIRAPATGDAGLLFP